MKTINVAIEEGYPVYLERGIRLKTAEILEELGLSPMNMTKIGIVTDSNVSEHYLREVVENIASAGFQVRCFVVKPGEQHKDMETLSSILEFLAMEQFTRYDYLISLGGGVVGDMTGLAAGLYMRGIGYIQMPTTLLAMVDASIGGKTAIDLSAGKNLAGLFIQPKAVIVDPDTLNSLTEDVFMDGMGEVIKTGILSGEELLLKIQELLEKRKNVDLSSGKKEEEEEKEERELTEMERDMLAAGLKPAGFKEKKEETTPERISFEELLDEIIYECIMYKNKIVSEDPKENGLRKILNLGHTPAHAIEKLSRYEITHGKAVMMGLEIIIKASIKSGFTDEKNAKLSLEVLKTASGDTKMTYSARELAKEIQHDKKRQQLQIDLVIPEKPGQVVLKKFGIFDVENFLFRGI